MSALAGILFLTVSSMNRQIQIESTVVTDISQSVFTCVCVFLAVVALVLFFGAVSLLHEEQRRAGWIGLILSFGVLVVMAGVLALGKRTELGIAKALEGV